MKTKRSAVSGLLIPLILSLTACSGGLGALPDSEAADAESPILYQDDFSDPSSGWDRARDETSITDYENGSYRMLVNESNTDIWANPGRNFSDTSIEVTATVIGGPEENDFGLICRYQDAGNFYVFLIGSDGFWGIGGVLDGEGLQLIGMEKMEFSPLINKGRAENQIRADCVGESLRLYINGTIVETVQDNRLREGDAGLIAGTFDAPGTDVTFDDFIVRRPE